MGVHEVAVATRNELTRRGWSQNDWITTDGRVCMFGAYLCGQRLDVDYATTRAVSLTDPGARELAGALGFRSVQDTMLWNDAPGRKFEDLVALLDAAIRKTAPLPADPLIGVPGYEMLGSAMAVPRGVWARAWRTAVAWIGFGRTGRRVPLLARFLSRLRDRRERVTFGDQLLASATVDPIGSGELLPEGAGAV